MKKMTDEQKSLFAQEIAASAVNVATSINDALNRKFNQLNNRLNKTDTRVNETKTLAENTNRLEQLEESKITNLRFEEYFRKIEQLEELVDDQIRNKSKCSQYHDFKLTQYPGVKFNFCNENSWKDTKNVWPTTLCT